ncbi:hypothetical protein [Vibrio sp. SCSIO 43137]|uniref:hypothetical protein n=1 Tax=Vibrio sp. SCSIO 43137 TaxID=3021011 RepID=UPI00230737EF|nr:hypothetical protein [Vibrio sp. SCSIO 43137]WCE32341.1 hypothetical protein PK654_17760 [Vibrio sp. SCSIO 43137]
MSHKQCPFCGSRKLSLEYLRSAWGSEEKEAHIVCDDCASSSPVYIWDLRHISNKAVSKDHHQRNASTG